MFDVEPDGLFKVDRAIFRHPFFKEEPFTEREAWLWLIGKARYEEGCIYISETRVDLQRGQLVTSIRFLSTLWKWSKDKTSRYLNRLKTATMIETRSATGSATGQTLITICNYETFQDYSAYRETVTRTRGETASATTLRQQRDNFATTPGQQQGQTTTNLTNPTNSTKSSSSPSESVIRKEEAEDDALNRVGSSESKTGTPFPFIDAYREAIVEVYGEEQIGYAYPTSACRVHDQRWTDEGMDVDDAKAVFIETLENAKANGKQPPTTLKYFDGFLRDRIADLTPVEDSRPSFGGHRPCVVSEETEWRAHMKHGWVKLGVWDNSMGPRPDEPGCRVPKEILAEFGIEPVPPRKRADPDEVKALLGKPATNGGEAPPQYHPKPGELQSGDEDWALREGLEYLQPRYPKKQNEELQNILEGWVRNYGAWNVRNAIQTAQVSAKQNPMKYILAILQNPKEVPPTGNGNGNERDEPLAEIDVDEQWRRWVGTYQRTEGAVWTGRGFEPGDPDCECPPHILDEFGYGTEQPQENPKNEGAVK